MKMIRCLAVIALGTLLSGCIVLSVYPFYTEKDLVDEPALAGTWGSTNSPGETWTFQALGKGAFAVSYSEREKTNRMDGHLFQLRGKLFLDLYATESCDNLMPPPIPAHMVSRVTHMPPHLRMEFMDYDWLRKYVSEHPRAVRHHFLQAPAGEERKDVVLTADTAELQKFLLKHLNTADAWKPMDLERVPRGQ